MRSSTILRTDAARTLLPSLDNKREDVAEEVEEAEEEEEAEEAEAERERLEKHGIM
tara:strand:+ start:2437 stop:2604 length:168 start_codon:yes stop_codon:yes gene_type:complete